MRILVTGSRGKVGRAAVHELQRAGHEVTGTDLATPVYERPAKGEAHYVQADLADAGVVHAIVRDMDAVVHAAAIPNPLHHASHVVFGNNVMAAFNVVEACSRWQIPRVINISSETVPGFIFAEREILPPYLPIDEATPAHPQDPYAFGKYVTEQWCDAVVSRSDISIVSIRPSWVQSPETYEHNIGPLVRAPDEPMLGFWSYTDNTDLAVAIRLASEAKVTGHEIVYVAQPDNCTGRSLVELVSAGFPDAGIDVRETSMPDASGIDSSKARSLLGWSPTRSWRDYLDGEGRRRPNAG